MKTKKPLALSDPMELWEQEAKRLDINVYILRDQIRLADAIIEDLIEEEKEEQKKAFENE